MQAIQDVSDVNVVLFQRIGEDEDIIEIVHYKDVSHVSEDMVHKGLKCSGCLGEPYRHNQELERAVSCPEGGFPLVASCNANIVVASMEVKLGVDLCTAQLVEEVGDKGNWVAILLGDLVQVPEINTESQTAIFLLRQEDMGTGW